MRRLLAVLFICVLFVGCSASSSDELIVQTAEGVELHGCGQQRGGWILNTNDYPVRVRRVVCFHFSEQTRSIDRLPASERLEFGDVWLDNSAFHIYTMDGVLVGFISGKCPLD
jgi:hypothetical protein